MEEKKPEDKAVVGESLEGANSEASANAPTDQNDVNALEGNANSAAAEDAKSKQDNASKKRGSLVQNIISRLNIYLLLFVLILVLSGGLILVGIQREKKAATPDAINTTPLTQEAIDKLKGSEAKVGDPKQTLAIESNAIFSGKVLIRDSLDVAGTIKVGGSLTLPGISVSGTSTFDQIQANNLSISGNATVQGQLNVQQTLTVTGGASFGGPISAPQLSIENFQLNGDLQLNRHIDAGGGTPGRTDGGALGSGGTSSVSGSDTAGTITINTGSNTAAGCFITVIFSQKFNGTPHVVVTPVGSGGASLNYYVTRNTTSFSLCITNPAAPAGTNFSFDYVAID
jgi:cytoskeletal protein CcmA (bactofilin family)